MQRKAFVCDFVSWSFHLHLNSNFRYSFGQCFAALSSLVTTPQQNRIHNPTLTLNYNSLPQFVTSILLWMILHISHQLSPRITS